MTPPSPDTPQPRSRHAAGAVRDLRGGVRLMLDGVRAGIDELEAVHRRLADVDPPVRGMRVAKPGAGLGAVLYRGLRGTTELLGGSLDFALASVQASLTNPQRDRTPADPQPTRESLLAALNAVAGDHLARTDNPLAIGTRLQARAPAAMPRAVVLVHDLGLGDLQWRRNGHDHGEALADALGATPVYALYNTGRHVPSSGRELASALENLLASWKVPLEGVVLVGHGMGGLVLRSALYQAARSGLAWPAHVRKIVFLGTPHHGALQGFNLGAAPWGLQSALRPLARLARRQSEGMADFIEGRVLEEVIGGQPAEQNASAGLLAVSQCFAIAGAVGDSGSDGVVAVDSALGLHPLATRDLLLPREHRFIASGVDHLGLLESAAVFQAMRRWLSA